MPGTPIQLEVTSHKDQPNGYPSLDSGGRIPIDEIPASAAPSSAFQRPYLHRALANVLTSTKDAKIGLLGESTTYGYTGVGGTPSGIGPALAIVQALAGGGIPAALGMVIPNSILASGTDPRWTVGAGWSQINEDWSFGGVNPAYEGALGAGANTLSFTPSGGAEYDRFDLYYIVGAATGSGFTVNVDGGAPTVVVTGPLTPGIGKTTITCPAASNHVVNFGVTTGSAQFIFGIEPWMSTESRVRVGNMGVSSTTTVQWTATAGNAGYGPLDAIRAYGADAWIVSLGINDMNDGVLTATTFANLLTIGAACAQDGADVFFGSPVPSSPSSLLNEEVTFAAALEAWCTVNGYGFIDQFARWGGLNGYTELEPLGLYWDIYHPTQVGYADIGRGFAAALLSA